MSRTPENEEREDVRMNITREIEKDTKRPRDRERRTMKTTLLLRK